MQSLLPYLSSEPVGVSLALKQPLHTSSHSGTGLWCEGEVHAFEAAISLSDAAGEVGRPGEGEAERPLAAPPHDDAPVEPRPSLIYIYIYIYIYMPPACQCLYFCTSKASKVGR